MSAAKLVLWVNGTRMAESEPDPREPLIAFLRRRGLSGTKLGCAEGGCGSCTVVVTRVGNGTLRHHSANACLLPLCSLHGQMVTTIEGLSTTNVPSAKSTVSTNSTADGCTSKSIHPAQQAVSSLGGSQCGFCSPGIVMSLYAEMCSESPSIHSIEDCFDGNLCRCTGYRPIIEGARNLVLNCKNDCNSCESHVDIEDTIGQNKKCTNQIQPPKVPADMLQYHTDGLAAKSYTFNHKEYIWMHPSTLNELLECKFSVPNAKIINGNTEIGIETRFKSMKYKMLIHASDISELNLHVLKDDGVEFGAATTLTDFQSRLKNLCNQMPDFKCSGFKALLDNIKYFAGKQIRNVSAIGGNIVTASPISDLNPVLVSIGAVLTVASHTGGYRYINTRDFFLGYRRTALTESEVLISVFIPYSKPLEFITAFKQSKRRDDDIAIANCGLRILLDAKDGVFTIKESCFAFGGMGPTTLQCKTTSDFLSGKEWTTGLLQSEKTSALILQDLPLSATSPGGQIEFRKTLALSFLVKYSIQISLALSAQTPKFSVSSDLVSCVTEIHRPISLGAQVFQESDKQGSVGKSVVHVAADKQVTGQAVYVDDMPRFHNEVYAAIIGSSISHGRIKSVDYSQVLALEGVLGIVDSKDVHSNIIGPVFKDEELFATSEVHHIGQMIAMVLAESEQIAKEAAKLCIVEYDVLPSIYTIEDAIAAKSFFPVTRVLERGAFSATNQNSVNVDIEDAVNHVVGVARMSGQDHFYLETNVSIAVPGKEDDEMEIYASTQNPTETQHLVAHVLGVSSNRVVTRVKRLGGGFGGKETRSVFLSCGLAVAARKFGVPARCMLSREEDMAITGIRHPFLGKYKVGFTNDGKLVSLELDVFNNAGYSMDLSLAVLVFLRLIKERSMTHCDNSYMIPHLRVAGRICKTNLPTNTAFRGFGGPQGLMIAEQYITHVAEYLGKSVESIRALNLYANNDVTHFSMPLECVYLGRCWNELKESVNFQQQRDDVDAFNRVHKYRKRGVALMPTKFGLAFTARFLNQAAALVHVYTDGSVRLSHGGTEMGQGLHTKMIQVAADCLGIPIEMVHISETRTDVVANTSATAASVSSDLNGMAILDACLQIMGRLDPLRKASPTLTWKELVNAAYMDRINLSANGFYKTPDLDFDWATNTGKMFSYFTYGVAFSLVEIDVLTGDHVCLRSDILMDIGRPINPRIDIGQIEGAFVQGMGWCTLEEPLISPKTGFLLTRGPGLYKIPGFKDIPVEFNVSIMSGVRNSRAIHSSKAVGEPPFFLGASVFFAIRDAISNARTGNGKTGHFRVDSPATSERIRIACHDSIVDRCKTVLEPGEKCWGVPA